MSIFGKIFRVMTFGQSHSLRVGCVIQGFPSNFVVDLQHIQKQLNRRRPGQSLLTTVRDEKDVVSCISGLENNTTLGSPLCFEVNNQNVKKSDYNRFSNIPRPGHADITYLRKYGVKAESGGGRSSARQTIGRVIAGALAKQYLKTLGISFASWVLQVGDVRIPQHINQQYIRQKISNEEVERRGELIQLEKNKYLIKDGNGEYKIINVNEGQIAQQAYTGNKPSINPVNLRCPHNLTAFNIYDRIASIKSANDSLGGIVQGCIYNLTPGLGNPVFDKLPAVMAHGMMSIPATKGFEFGSGFSGTKMRGSEHNDVFNKDLSLKTNNSGGTLGGISTGQTFDFRVAFKPVSTIGVAQKTHDFSGEQVILEGKGRHDPCVLPRAPPIVDNMAAMVIMDAVLCNRMG